MNEKTYRINEIFYSLQGEGRWAGCAAAFIRFSGCNLKCPFCDTDFKDYVEMTCDAIIEEVKPWADCQLVVLTGGEPTLQADETLIDSLHKMGFFVAMETNGTKKPPKGIDWVTVSPKDFYVGKDVLKVHFANEVKMVMDDEIDEEVFHKTARKIDAPFYYVQPCDTGDPLRNRIIVRRCADFIMKNPKWTLSLQQQKIINVK